MAAQRVPPASQLQPASANLSQPPDTPDRPTGGGGLGAQCIALVRTSPFPHAGFLVSVDRAVNVGEGRDNSGSGSGGVGDGEHASSHRRQGVSRVPSSRKRCNNPCISKVHLRRDL
ncbi:hypothetical protein E2C01_033958 [Portunus trituberculatus]|uniref:Uncharacterized protein n=1 Tax=Portunus trituberculatus TaxID=210409 RepID=A0A5B7F5M5_PORTR|nr:hypothetical protein [Portunus trituberculatus]